MRQTVINEFMATERLYRGVIPPEANPYFEYDVDIIGLSAHSWSVPSVKYAGVLGMLEGALERKRFENTRFIVEESSGNTAVALGMLAPRYGISPSNVTAIVPKDIAPGKRGALDVIGVNSKNADPGETSAETAARLGSLPGHWNPNQYCNRDNENGHYDLTGRQVLDAVGPDLASFSMSIGSGGTITGVARRLRESCRNIVIVGAMCRDKAEIPGVRDEGRMAQVTLPWRQACDITVKMATRPAYLGALILNRFAGIPSGPSGGLNFVALLRSLQELKVSGMLTDIPHNPQGRVVAGFLVPDSFYAYTDRFTAHLPGTIVNNIDSIPWDLVYRDDW